MHSSPHRTIRTLSVIVALLCLSMLPPGGPLAALAPPVAHAAPPPVTSTADSGAGSLRQAIIDAANGDTITFNLPASSIITLSNQIDFSTALTIDGVGAPGLTISGNNANRVFRIGAAVTLANMTIANGLSAASSDGGAVYVFNTSPLTLTDVVVRDSVAGDDGGGVYAGGPLTVSGGRFENNRTPGGSGNDGGGVYAADTSSISGTQVISNTASIGGGAFVFNNATITSSSFLSNTAPSGGGGGLFSDTAAIISSSFISNTAQRGGGAFIVGTAAITDTSMISNTAQDEGGALFIANSSGSTIHASRLLDNTAVNGGGALYLASAEATMENNFVGGSTGVNGVPIGLGQAPPPSNPSSLTAIHNTFAATTPGQGVAINAGKDIAGDTVTLTNTIFDGYATALQTGPNAATISADGVLFSNVTTPTEQLGGSGAINVTNAITGTAAFVDAAARNYHLTSASDAIDTGVASSLTTDIDGQTRPNGAAPDLGADEFSNMPPTAVNDSYTTTEDAVLTVPAPGVLGNDTDPEGNPLAASLQTAPTTGTLTLNADGSFSYTPPAGFSGTVTFSYVANDGELDSQPATVTITVTPDTTPPGNTPPTISAIANQTTAVNTPVGPLSFTVGDADGDSLTVTASSSNTTLVPNASIVLGGSGANRTVTITPAAGQVGTTTITITVSDGTATASTTFTLTVTPSGATGASVYLPLIRK